jgi:hypothetical protein
MIKLTNEPQDALTTAPLKAPLAYGEVAKTTRCDILLGPPCVWRSGGEGRFFRISAVAPRTSVLATTRTQVASGEHTAYVGVL